MSRRIPRRGRLHLQDGELVAWTDTDEIVGRIFVGPDGLTIQGELTVWQDEDPPKMRFASHYQSWRGALGAISFNVVREDGKQEEVGWCRGSLAEDAQPGELRGQLDVYLRQDAGAEPVPVLILSDAYTREESGTRRLRVYVRQLVKHLWKFAETS